MEVNTPWMCGSFFQQIIGNCPMADKYLISLGVKMKRYFLLLDDWIVIVTMHISLFFYSYSQFAHRIIAWLLSIEIRTRCVL